jgi:DNA polymerase III subunit delta'
VLLAASNGRPLDALALAQAGVDARTWTALPAAVAQGRAAVLSGWPVPRVLDALYKLCHDALACAAGGAPRYFPRDPALAQGQPARLAAWSRELARVARHAEHPWNEGLLLEALVKMGAEALAPARTAPRAAARGFDTLRP